MPKATYHLPTHRNAGMSREAIKVSLPTVLIGWMEYHKERTGETKQQYLERLITADKAKHGTYLI